MPRPARVFSMLDDDALIETHGRGAGRGSRRSAGSRAAWSSVRARSARARSSAIRARRRCRRSLNLQGQVSRELSARSRRRCCARTSPTGSSSTATAPTCCSSPTCCQDRRRAMTARRGGAVRHRQAQRAALGDSGGHARRLFGAHPDRARARPIRASTRCSTAFKAATGCPVLVNTSFNVRGEPIVCTPEDAFRCFMGTEIETAGRRQLRAAQGRSEPGLKQDYSSAFELD